MDASLESKAEQLAADLAGQATTIDELNALMWVMMKSGSERINAHWSGNAAAAAATMVSWR